MKNDPEIAVRFVPSRNLVLFRKSLLIQCLGLAILGDVIKLLSKKLEKPEIVVSDEDYCKLFHTKHPTYNEDQFTESFVARAPTDPSKS